MPRVLHRRDWVAIKDDVAKKLDEGYTRKEIYEELKGKISMKYVTFCRYISGRKSKKSQLAKGTLGVSTPFGKHQELDKDVRPDKHDNRDNVKLRLDTRRNITPDEFFKRG